VKARVEVTAGCAGEGDCAALEAIGLDVAAEWKLVHG
jgi:hypothetical protein